MRILAYLFLFSSLHAQPLLIAHRGASEAAPENTLAAFKAAWSEGADGIEGDFHLSKDGKIVCIHDEDTKRTTGKKLIVSQTPSSQLRQLDAGSWKAKKFADERIPLLDEVLAILPEDKYFFIEIKCGPKIVSPLQTALQRADPKRVILISFDASVVKACRQHLPDFQAHLVTKLDGISKRGRADKQLDLLDQLDATGVQFKHSAPVSPAFMERLKSELLMTASWTVNDAKTARRIAGLGVDFITTDRPAALRAETGWSQ